MGERLMVKARPNTSKARLEEIRRGYGPDRTQFPAQDDPTTIRDLLAMLDEVDTKLEQSRQRGYQQAKQEEVSRQITRAVASRKVVTLAQQGPVTPHLTAEWAQAVEEGFDQLQVACLEEGRLDERERIADLLYDWDSFFSDHHLAEGGNWACRFARIIKEIRQPPETKYGGAKTPADDPWKDEFWQ